MPSSGFKTCALDRKSTRLNSSHTIISDAVFCLKKKTRAARWRALRALSGGLYVGISSSAVRTISAHPGGQAIRPGSPADTGASLVFFLTDAAPPEISTLPHPDALPI